MCDNVKACSNEFDCCCANTDCENYKRCCACIASHRERGNLPCCLRTPETD